MSDKLPEPGRGTSLNLYNRFAELLLVVGLNEHTGLVPLKKDTDSDEEGEDTFSGLFSDEYEAQVLVAISASKAIVFQPYLEEDPTYPPSAESFADLNSNQTLSSSGRHFPTSFARSVSAQRNVSINATVLKQHLTNTEHSSSTAANVSELPLSKDTIEAVTTFCFPDNARVYQDKPDNSIHFLVLTDVAGSKTYASCLTFYKPYRLTKEQDGTIRCNLDNPEQATDSAESVLLCYMPQCCVLFSKYPYFSAMKECLSCMISHVERDLVAMYQSLKEFTFNLTMAPIPPAGDVIVEMSVCNLSVPLIPSDSPEKPIIDLPLHLSFLCFPIDELLKIFTAILCEERLVFVSFNYALLTTVMESFLYYILPFNWRFTYVPILSASSLELLDAPGTFMMGCNSRYLHDVVKVEGLVVVNIDEGTVVINNPESMSPISPMPSDIRENFVVFESRESRIPKLPVEPTSIFKKICKRARFQMELSDVQRPFFYTIEEERAYRIKKYLQFNTEISFIFLEMMVNLFRGILPFLKMNHQHFNKPQFVDSLPDCDKPFYNKVLATDMFKEFLMDRLTVKVDYWYEHEKKTQPWARRNSGQLATPAVGITQRHQHKPFRKQVSVTTFASMSPRVFEVFKLPPLSDSISFSQNAIALLNKAVEESRNISLRYSYTYLRGMYHASTGNTDAALNDLLSLHAHNARLIPTSFIHKLLQQIPEAEREDAVRKRGSIDLEDLGPSKISPRPKPTGEPIPNRDLSLDDFVKTVCLLEMATDYTTIKHLFTTLSSPDTPNLVDKYTFDVFWLSYQENLSQCDALVLPNGILQDNEVILRVSNLIKTDFGMGRMVLTDKRLFFIKDVSNKCREIVKLRNIVMLEKVQYHSFLRPVDALLITESGNKKFVAWLKNERNCWSALIEEMRAGKIVAEATKDFTAISHAIQNVLLIDAVIRSGQDELASHYGQVSVDELCYFSSFVSDGRHILPRDTSSALQHRVDPNIGQRDRKTVLVMLYTPGSSYSNTSPRLWCGMGDGKVRVFDAISWVLEESFVQTKNTVSALIAVGETQVWAGSHAIFIIDTETMSHRILVGHPDLVVDIILTHQGRHAFSASVDGTIIQWELQTLQIVNKMHLLNIKSLRNLRIYDNKLWCGTWQSITALDMDCNPLQTFTHTYEDTGKIMDLDCFEVFNDEIWAGCRREGQVIVWDEITTRKKEVLKPDCSGISVLLLSSDKVWVGTKDGTIYIYNAVNKQLWKVIKAHDDAIRSLCSAESRYIMSGSGSKDGKIAIWKPHFEADDHDVNLMSVGEHLKQVQL